MPDPVADYLRTLNTSDRARAAAWDAVYVAKDDADRQRRLQQLPFSDDVRADLWELAKGGSVSGGSAPQPASAEQFMDPQAQAPQGSATRRFINGAWHNLNPVTMVTGIANAVAHPIDTAKHLYQAQADQFTKAGDALDRGGVGGVTEAVGRAAAGTLPLLGPAAARSGDAIASGDVAGGLGQGAGLLVPFAADAALTMRGRATAPTRAANLEREATQQVATQFLAPGNSRYVGRAQAMAPEVLQRGLTGDRTAVRELAQSGMETAATHIDDAITSAGGGVTAVPVQPIIARLRTKMQELMTETQTTTPVRQTPGFGGARTGGQTVAKLEPIEGAAGKVAELQSRIQQLERAGKMNRGTVSFDELRKIRDANYDVASAARGYERAGNVVAGDSGWAARETGGAIREQFANQIPELATANADFHFWKTLDEVLDPAIGRPKATKPSSGITGGARVSGATMGALTGSPTVTFVMSVVLPWLKERASDPSWILADANRKMALARAIEKGNTGLAQRLMLDWGKYGKSTPAPSQPSSAPQPVAP